MGVHSTPVPSARCRCCGPNLTVRVGICLPVANPARPSSSSKMMWWVASSFISTINFKASTYLNVLMFSTSSAHGCFVELEISRVKCNNDQGEVFQRFTILSCLLLSLLVWNKINHKSAQGATQEPLALCYFIFVIAFTLHYHKLTNCVPQPVAIGYFI